MRCSPGTAGLKWGIRPEFGTVESRPKEAETKAQPRPAEKRRGRSLRPNANVKSRKRLFAYHVPYMHVVFDPSGDVAPYDPVRALDGDQMGKAHARRERVRDLRRAGGRDI